MRAFRARLGSAVEWLVAGIFLAATIAVGSLIVRELRAVTTVTAAPETFQPLSTPPLDVPARAIAVPMVLLPDGKEVRVGETARDVAELLGRRAETGRQQIDQVPLGQRVTRYYEYAGARFVLVFEPFERNGALKIAAIYVQ